jgi:hypothetical protein
MINWDGVLLVKLTESILMPLFVCYLIHRATMQDFRDFVDTLHRPGASILVSYVLLITGVIMMKIMLYDDGKYVVGVAIGVFAKSLTPSTDTKSEEKGQQ